MWCDRGFGWLAGRLLRTTEALSLPLLRVACPLLVGDAVKTKNRSTLLFVKNNNLCTKRDAEQFCNFVRKIMGAFTESITALLPLLQKLQWQEKVTLIQILAAELAEQDSALLLSSPSYPVWTPLDA